MNLAARESPFSLNICEVQLMDCLETCTHSEGYDII